MAEPLYSPEAEDQAAAAVVCFVTFKNPRESNGARGNKEDDGSSIRLRIIRAHQYLELPAILVQANFSRGTSGCSLCVTWYYLPRRTDDPAFPKAGAVVAVAAASAAAVAATEPPPLPSLRTSPLSPLLLVGVSSNPSW